MKIKYSTFSQVYGDDRRVTRAEERLCLAIDNLAERIQWLEEKIKNLESQSNQKGGV